MSLFVLRCVSNELISFNLTALSVFCNGQYMFEHLQRMPSVSLLSKIVNLLTICRSQRCLRQVWAAWSQLCLTNQQSTARAERVCSMRERSRLLTLVQAWRVAAHRLRCRQRAKVRCRAALRHRLAWLWRTRALDVVQWRRCAAALDVRVRQQMCKAVLTAWSSLLVNHTGGLQAARRAARRCVQAFLTAQSAAVLNTEDVMTSLMAMMAALCAYA